MNDFAVFRCDAGVDHPQLDELLPGGDVAGRAGACVACQVGLPPPLPAPGRVARALAATLGALLVGAALSACRSEPPPPPGAAELAGRMLAGKLSSPGLPYDLPYRLFVPAGYSEGRRYPLIVFLHGSGSNGSDNLRQLTPSVGVLLGRAQTIEPAFVLVPQAPDGDKWVSGSVGPPFRNYRQTDRPQSPAAQLVLVGIDELRAKYAIDPDRIYLTGASAGGAGTWDLITRNGTGRFAAAVPVTGANDPSRAAVIARLPIWVFHGANDELSPVENTREMVGNLRALGSPVKYTEYPGVGHDSWGPAYAELELFPWLFSQRRGDDAPRP
jgi:predicted peptidase